MTQILPDPIVNLDKDGRLVKLHCGTPGERCNLDNAKNKKTVPWAKVMWIMKFEEPRLKGILCWFCFGGVW